MGCVEAPAKRMSESHWDTPATCWAWLPWGPLEWQESHSQPSPCHPQSVLVWTILHNVALPLDLLCQPVCLLLELQGF